MNTQTGPSFAVIAAAVAVGVLAVVVVVAVVALGVREDRERDCAVKSAEAVADGRPVPEECE